MGFVEDCGRAAAALEAQRLRAVARSGPVIHQPPMAGLAETLGLDRLIAEGGLGGERLDAFLSAYLEASTRLHHPGYMAHQVAVPHPQSSIAALVGAYTNNPMAIYEMGPAAATVEYAVLNWMLGKTGWTPSPVPGSLPERGGGRAGGGVLTHGGSLANLTALQAARARVAPKSWEEGTPANLVLVAPKACHYSIARAAAMMGLGQKAVSHAPSDAEGRLDPEKLGTLLARLRNEGHVPLAVVANACSTALGLYDPIRDVAAVCNELGIWLHVDGAHGASALVSPRHRGLLDGVELADSMVWDAHKMLRTPCLSAAVLVRDARDLDRAFREDASYLFHDKDQPGFDFIHRTVECTKAALGLKVFFALAAEGESGMAAYIDRQFDLAKSAAAFLRAQPDVEVAVEPQSNIVCFRLAGSDALQIELRRRLVEDGRYYISTAEALGKRWLRLALMNPATELSDIEGLVHELVSCRDAIHALR